MSDLCAFCSFKKVAADARAKADAWDAERIPGLAAPHRKIALEFDALAHAEKACTCGQPRKRTRLPIKGWKKYEEEDPL